MVLIRRAGPINIDGRKYDKGWLDREIRKSRDPRRNADSGLAADPLRAPRPGSVASRQVKQASKLDIDQRLFKALEVLREGGLANLKPLLPLLFSLGGKPYHIDDHYTFEPFFATRQPRRLVYKTARQVAKSTSLASQGVLQSNAISYFNTLYVTPLFELIRRFSSNYVRGFIEQSPMRNLLVDSSCNNNVLQRSFRNHSTMFFSFAFLNADRTRGLNCAKTAYDEVQDFDLSFIPIIRETMSGSAWGFEQYTGTPKTKDGSLENLWRKSSRAEWHIWCRACGHENIPSIDHDLDAMVGPSIVRREISERYPGVVCAKCGRPVYPREGRWVHHYPSRRLAFAGYHVPQIVMPMHYADSEKWGVLLGKRDGYGNTAVNVYYNEVCGESYDSGAKLVTQTELIAACDNRPNDLHYAASRADDYVERILAVDWGGGGQDEVSYTVAVVLGYKANGAIDVLYAHRFRTMHDYANEARAIIYIMNRCRCSFLVHDMGGRGDIREHLLVTAGLPRSQSLPVSYIRATVGPIFRFKEENLNTGQRAYYLCDKARSLVQTCELIRHGQVRFFAWDEADDRDGVISDFLSLTEDIIDSRTGNEIFTVIRSELGGPDDFAQAVNIGTCALFYLRKRWPDLAAIARIKADPRVLAQFSPAVPNWNDY